jgi:hypothetical protein
LLEDGDLMFRVNEHTTLTDEGREVLGAARITAARVTHTARATEIDSAETEATA